MKVTIDWLEDQEGCKDEVKIFALEWPNGAELTPENLARAVDLDLNISWLARKMLKDRAWYGYCKDIAPAWNAHDKAIAPARADYRKAIAHAMDEFNKATAPARATLYRNILPHVIEALCKEESK